MGDKARGLYRKFRVLRTDGTSDPGGKHDGCDYFVLDLTHDPFAIPALAAYERACRAEYPLLAADLRAKMSPAAEPTPERKRGHGRLTLKHVDSCGCSTDGGPDPRCLSRTEPTPYRRLPDPAPDLTQRCTERPEDGCPRHAPRKEDKP